MPHTSSTTLYSSSNLGKDWNKFNKGKNNGQGTSKGVGVTLMLPLVLLMFQFLKTHQVNFKSSTILEMDFLPIQCRLAASSDHYILSSYLMCRLMFRSPLINNHWCPSTSINTLSSPHTWCFSSLQTYCLPSLLIISSIGCPLSSLCKSSSAALCLCASFAAPSLLRLRRSSLASTIHRSHLHLPRYSRSTSSR